MKDETAWTAGYADGGEWAAGGSDGVWDLWDAAGPIDAPRDLAAWLDWRGVTAGPVRLDPADDYDAGLIAGVQAHIAAVLDDTPAAA